MAKPKWKQKLNKTQLHHVLTDAGCRTLEQFKRSCEVQDEWRHKNPDPVSEPCWDCWEIEQLLGLNEHSVTLKITVNRTGGVSVDGTHFGPSTSVGRFLRGLIADKKKR